MTKYFARRGLLVLACLLLVACQDRHGPVKPTVGLAGNPAVAARSVA